MPQHSSTNHFPHQRLIHNRPVTDSAIAALLGQGLGYKDWEQRLRSDDYMWNEGVKNMIIKKEREIFMSEILRLESEQGITQDGISSNSLPTILKRLKGEEWFPGMPCERQDRLKHGRLLGKDAKLVGSSSFSLTNF
jgi:hypothetical protein